MAEQKILDVAARVDALREEHSYITSVDGCCFCGDCECDGVGCIASIDPDAAGAGGPGDHDYDELGRLHEELRAGQAWRVFQAVLDEENDPVLALMLAEEALAHAENRGLFTDCEGCGRSFTAVGPCDDRCIPCRLTAASEGVDRG